MRSMNLSELLEERCICLQIKNQNKSGSIRELSELAMNCGQVKNLDTLIDALMTRERLQTTGIGRGIAIPHATAEGVQGLVAVLGLSKQGIDFQSLDNKPVHLVFLLAGEPQRRTSFLSILGKVSHFFRNQTFFDEVLKAESAADIISFIQEHEQ